MLKSDQIPEEAVEAARAAYREGFELLDSHEKIMRASIAAALSAWPGVRVKAVLLADTVLLPLPQEVSDEKSTTEEGRA